MLVNVNKIKLTVFLLASAMFIICFLFAVHDGVKAQQLGAIITFEQSITTDEEGGRLYFPNFVYSDPFSNEIYVIDGKSRIIIHTHDLFPLLTLGRKDGIESPQGLTVDEHGNLYVIQMGKDKDMKYRISVFDSCLKWNRDIFLDGFEDAESFIPYRIAVDKKGNLYVAANNYPAVLYINSYGRLIDTMFPDEGGEKAKIINVTLDKTGRVYLVSEEKGRIYVYDSDRKFIFKFGEKGGSSGKLSRPKAAGIDNRYGRIYVVDYMRHTINVYNKEGKFIFEFGGMGWSEGWFQFPVDLAVDNEGRIVVADLFNQRVQVFNSW